MAPDLLTLLQWHFAIAARFQPRICQAESSTLTGLYVDVSWRVDVAMNDLCLVSSSKAAQN